MPTTTFNLRGSTGSRLDELRDAFRRGQAALAAWRRRRALFANTVSELTHLTDRDLADLGIPRADIRAIAREAAFGGTE